MTTIARASTLIELLAIKPRTSQELAGIFGIGEARLQRRLNKMAKKGILDRLLNREDGRRVLYRLHKTESNIKGNVYILTEDEFNVINLTFTSAFTDPIRNRQHKIKGD